MYQYSKPEAWNWSPAFLSRDGQALARGLVSLVPFWEGGGDATDYVTRNTVVQPSGEGWVQTKRGIASNTATSGAGERWAWNGSSFTFVPIGGEVTVIIHKRKTDGTNRTAYGFGIESTPAAGERCNSHIPFSDGVVYWDYGGVTDGTSRESYSGATFGDDFWGFTAGTRGMEIWQNGELRASHGNHGSRAVVSTNKAFVINGGNGVASDLAECAFFAMWDRQLSQEEVRLLTIDPWVLCRYDPRTPFISVTPAPSAAITGTAGDGATEAEIVAGGDTIIITLTNDTWVASGATFDAQRQNIIDGIDSAQAEATGWDAVVKAGLAVTDVARTSDTVVTVTLPAFGSYNITADETITVTVPGSAVTAASPIVATPTFQVTHIPGKAMPPFPNRVLRVWPARR